MNGKPLTESQRLAVSRITFEEKATFTSKVEVVFQSGQLFDLRVADVPHEGELTLTLGWGDNLQEVFNGEIIEDTPSFQSRQPSELTVVGYDRSYQLKKMRLPAEMYDVRKMVDVVTSVLKKYTKDPFDLEYFVDPNAKIHDYLLIDSETGFRTDEETDWEFLTLIAEANNMLIFVRGKKIYFVTRNWFQQPATTGFGIVPMFRFNLYFKPHPEDERDPLGINLYHFKPRNSSLLQREKVEIVGWQSVDARGVKRGEGEVQELRGELNYTRLKVKRKFTEIFTIRGKAASDLRSAKVLAENEAERRARTFIEGQASMKGWPFVRMGQKHNFVIRDLGDFGAKFSGEYFISGTEHSWSRESGYRTSIDVERKSLSE